MKIKTIIVLLCFVIAIISIAPVNAKLDPDIYLRGDWTDENNHRVLLDVWSDIGLKTKNPDSAKYSSARKSELNTVNKIIIKISGLKTTTFNKPTKGWKTETSQSAYNHVIRKDFSVKGTYKELKNKDYSVTLYDKKNKILKNKKGKLKY